jgi:UDPglucose--hexose-1-phosphate uridylyltransferase
VTARKTTVTLADGRKLMYFGPIPACPADYPDRRQLAPATYQSEARFDWLLREWVVVASHRQDRTFQPLESECPLCPSTAGYRTEIPAPEYGVVVFENRFPAFASHPAGTPATPAQPSGVNGLLRARPAAGRSEVVCFTQRHDASLTCPR